MSSKSENIFINETETTDNKSKSETVDRLLEAYKFLSCISLVTFKITKAEFFNQIYYHWFEKSRSIIPVIFKRTSMVLNFPFLPEEILIHSFSLFNSSTGTEILKTYDAFLKTEMEWFTMDYRSNVLYLYTNYEDIFNKLKDILSDPEYDNHIL